MLVTEKSYFPYMYNRMEGKTWSPTFKFNDLPVGGHLLGVASATVLATEGSYISGSERKD